MLSRRSLLVGGVMTALGVGVSRRSEASVARALSLSELVHTSQHACVATPVDIFGQWETVGRNERIVTYTLVRVEYPLDGRAPSTSELMVRTLGGRVGDVGQVVPGEATLRLNESSTVFLQTLSRDLFAVTAMAQGHYPILSDEKGVKRLRSRTAFLEFVKEPGALAAVKRLEGRTVPEVEKMIFTEMAK